MKLWCTFFASTKGQIQTLVLPKKITSIMLKFFSSVLKIAEMLIVKSYTKAPVLLHI
jgi:hypothetical protein